VPGVYSLLFHRNGANIWYADGHAAYINLIAVGPEMVVLH